MPQDESQRFQVSHVVGGDRLPELISLLSTNGFGAPRVAPASVDNAREEGVMPVATAVELAEWEFKLSREGETYQWPELVEQYSRFDVYRGANGLGTIDFAIGECGRANVWGRDRKYFIVFHVTAGFKRPISEFLEADDYEETRELIAIIRGKGGGRKMYDPTDDLPIEYEPFRIETYRDRIDVAGSWNKLAVVAHEDDVATMLNHGLIQAQSRFDIKPY
jgi:hypothetical protein